MLFIDTMADIFAPGSSVGEHTSVNHAWIFSALESATRGVVQLLLEDGLVDEAKEVSSSETANRSWRPTG